MAAANWTELQDNLAPSMAAMGCSVTTEIGRGSDGCGADASSPLDVCWRLSVSTTTELSTDSCRDSLERKRCARSTITVIVFEDRVTSASAVCAAEPDIGTAATNTAGTDLDGVFLDADGSLCGMNIHNLNANPTCMSIRFPVLLSPRGIPCWYAEVIFAVIAITLYMAMFIEESRRLTIGFTRLMEIAAEDDYIVPDSLHTKGDEVGGGNGSSVWRRNVERQQAEQAAMVRQQMVKQTAAMVTMERQLAQLELGDEWPVLGLAPVGKDATSARAGIGRRMREAV
ncbi:hypothetical protein FOA52_012376 [Chlamydomonas sp. UWO 241]|nr:hypothetical protein FOA52_012376 [Chlamydomonas sp. UWO 241]